MYRYLPKQVDSCLYLCFSSKGYVKMQKLHARIGRDFLFSEKFEYIFRTIMCSLRTQRVKYFFAILTLFYLLLNSWREKLLFDNYFDFFKYWDVFFKNTQIICRIEHDKKFLVYISSNKLYSTKFSVSKQFSIWKRKHWSKTNLWISIM